jgi:hypothetical protein
MKKNFYHKIGVAELLAEVVKTPEADRSQWILDFALDLVDDNERKCKTPFAKELISRTKSGRKKQASDGAKGGKKKAENIRKNKDISSHPTESASVTIASSRSSSSNRSRISKEEPKPLSECFALCWEKYPNKQGRKEAQRHYNATVKTEEDFKDICTAMSNYIAFIENPDTYQGYKHGATWFNNWQDWITFVPPPEKIQPVKKSEDFKKLEAIMGVNHVATGNNQNQSSETILTPQVRPQQRRIANDHGAMD